MHHADDGARSLTLTNSSHIEHRESPGGLTDFLSRGASGGGGGGRERPEKTNQVSTNAVPSAAGDLRVWPSSSNQSSGIPPRPLLAVGLNPKRIIKGSFLQEAPHITLPPLNHICSAISSSSTCSNFALEKKKSLSAVFLSVLQLSVVAFSSRAHISFTLTSSLLIIFRLKLGLLLCFLWRWADTWPLIPVICWKIQIQEIREDTFPPGITGS